ncbi:hypothetical protein C8J57DRAFT_509163 [Mycena rebaudengoi]|nr:hypothetical protein C8J57DRAFT_509163 [Mycena rebaudengoi]
MTPSPLEKFVLDARDKAITASDATYLAACDTSTLTWYAGPNDSAYLVAKEDVRTAEEALPNHLADPGNHPAPSAPEPVVLSMIARIPTDSFYMTSCGMWRGPKKAAQTFDKTAGTLTAAHPNLADLDQDFNSVLAKLLTLRRLAITHKVYRGVFKSEDDKTRLRLRHVLFENVQVAIHIFI